MSRIARLVLPEFPHHIIHRGNNRQKIFRSDKDREVYLDLIKKFARKWNCDVWAFCLMPNHVHLLLIPFKKDSLSKMMQGIALTYTQFFNRRYNRTGRIWECRFHSSIVDKDNYLWSLLKYIETNPIRAGFVNDLYHYRWSSAINHLYGEKDDLVKDLDYIKSKCALFENIDYTHYLKETMDKNQYEYIHKMSFKGYPIGKEPFIKKIEDIFKIKLLKRSPGRPKKNIGLQK